jgi:hypothetical protein
MTNLNNLVHCLLETGIPVADFSVCESVLTISHTLSVEPDSAYDGYLIRELLTGITHRAGSLDVAVAVVRRLLP